MKILTGSLRGRGIRFTPHSHLRPTADKVRKALFDMIQGELEDKNVLDLFAGTGALGFEALSGGAGKVTFVENSKNQCRAIRENLKKLGLEDKAEIACLDAASALESLDKKKTYFDLVFLDPPYEKGLGLKALEALSASSLIHENSLIFLESRKNEKVFDVPPNLKEVKSKAYGDTRIRVYSKKL